MSQDLSCREEKELIQPKAAYDIATNADTGTGPCINGLRSGGQPLSDAEWAYFEPRLDADLSGVRVQNGTSSDEATCSVNAKAFMNQKNKLELGGFVNCKVAKSGDPILKMFDTTCARPCTEKHEKKHYEDMKPCCNKFNQAYMNAMKKSILSIEETIYMEKLYQLAFDIWKSHHRPWKEIRAFNEILLKDVKGNCFDKLREQNKCSENPKSQCCKEIDEQENNSLEQQKFYMEMFGMVQPVECDVDALLHEAQRLLPKPEKVQKESLFKKEDMIKYMDEYIRKKILESVHDIPGPEPEVLPEPED